MVFFVFGRGGDSFSFSQSDYSPVTVSTENRMGFGTKWHLILSSVVGCQRWENKIVFCGQLLFKCPI